MRFCSLILLLTCISAAAFAQTTITGTVRDAETGDVLVGANIVVENTTTGTTTDTDGRFELGNLPGGQTIIRISHVGYETVLRTAQPEGEAMVSLTIGLFKKVIETEQVVITASRNEQMISEVPGRIALLSDRVMKSTTHLSIDDMLKPVSGVHVDRINGIWGNATVNIRGITSSEQGRVLALVDGLPINKTDGGSVNWNRINANEVERIEVFKGPGSSVYGNNAMGGVVNIITKNPRKPGYQGYAEASYGTYNTIEQKAGISGRLSDEEGLSFRIAGYNRTSEGYNNVREAFRDAFVINGAMKEHGLDTKLGYDVSETTTLQAKYQFFDDRRGNGKKAKEENYQQYKTHYGSFLLKTGVFAIAVSADAFYQVENYLRTTEKYRTTSTGTFSSYDLIYVDADRVDYGGTINLAAQAGQHRLNAGLEVKVGSIDGADVYQTSTDVVANVGKMTFLSAFVQDEVRITEELKLSAGLRYDRVKFHDGAFTITGATAASSFMLPVAGPLQEYTWDALTPKFSLLYSFNENLSSYVAYSRGFRAASLDDLTRSGLISGGFKKANPELQPESVDNYELGFNFDIDKSLYFMPSVYTMTGNDFMYYINTGDSIAQGRSNRPIIIKNNITNVRFIGADVDVKYFLSNGLYCFANYTYTHSEILRFEGNTKLEGKSLTYTPRQMFNVGMSSLNPFVNASFNIHFQDTQYVSDDNAEKDGNGNRLIIGQGYTVDIKLWKKFFNLVTATVSVQNLFDKNDLTTYDRYTPGRMIYGGISCEL